MRNKKANYLAIYEADFVKQNELKWKMTVNNNSEWQGKHFHCEILSTIFNWTRIIKFGLEHKELVCTEKMTLIDHMWKEKKCKWAYHHWRLGQFCYQRTWEWYKIKWWNYDRKNMFVNRRKNRETFREIEFHGYFIRQNGGTTYETT